MSSIRQDAWTPDEDLLLAEDVLRHIREGGTQLLAFEEVGKQLSRTSAACGFRWNSYVRKQYKSGIELAKKQRKEARKQHIPSTSGKEDSAEKTAVAQSVTDEPQNTVSFHFVVDYLQNLYEKAEASVQNDENRESSVMKIKDLEDRKSVV
jgi:prespore-specific regulator